MVSLSIGSFQAGRGAEVSCGVHRRSTVPTYYPTSAGASRAENSGPPKQAQAKSRLMDWVLQRKIVNTPNSSGHKGSTTMTGEPSNLALRRVAFAIRTAREALPASQTSQLSAHRHRPQAAKRMAQHCRGPRHQQPRSTDGAKDTSTRSQIFSARPICPTRPLAPPTRRPLAPISTDHLRRRPTRTPLADITPPPSATMESFERSRLGSIEPASTNHSSHRDPAPCFDDDIATKVELLGADQVRALLRHFACGNDALARAIRDAPIG